jgi:hypothetical protein
VLHCGMHAAECCTAACMRQSAALRLAAVCEMLDHCAHACVCMCCCVFGDSPALCRMHAASSSPPRSSALPRACLRVIWRGSLQGCVHHRQRHHACGADCCGS